MSRPHSIPITRGQVIHITAYLQEKPKEKTIFNVKLESFDPTSKPKVIKEVKAMVPNLTLIEVWPTVLSQYILQEFSSTFFI